MEHFDTFKKNYLVYGLPDERIREVMELGEYGATLNREYLIEKGTMGSDLFVILEGEAHVHDGQGKKIAEIKAPEVIGEVSLVDAFPRSADVQANGVVKYIRLPAKELRAYMSKNKDAGFVMLANLSRVLSMRLRNTSALAEALAGRAQDPWELGPG